MAKFANSDPWASEREEAERLTNCFALMLPAMGVPMLVYVDVVIVVVVVLFVV